MRKKLSFLRRWLQGKNRATFLSIWLAEPDYFEMSSALSNLSSRPCRRMKVDLKFEPYRFSVAVVLSYGRTEIDCKRYDDCSGVPVEQV